jgi:hypothetical protein
VSVPRVSRLSPRMLLGAGKRGKIKRERERGRGRGRGREGREREKASERYGLSLYMYTFIVWRERRLMKEFKEFSLFHVITWEKYTKFCKINHMGKIHKKIIFSHSERWQGKIGKIS